MKLVPLKEVCTLEYGKPLDKEFRKLNGDFFAYGANGPISSATKYLIEGPCVIVGRKGSAGEITYVEKNVWPLDVTYFIKHDPKQSHLRYLYFALQSLDIKQFVRGVKPGLNRNDVYGLSIPLPSLEKQREIVERLDSAFAEIDLLEAIYAKRNEDLSDHLFNTFRDDLLISSSNDQPRLEFGEIGNFVRGPFGGSLKKSIFKKSGLAVYEQQHAIYEKFTSFRYFVDEEKYQEMKRFEVKEGDLIMSCSGTYGKIAVVPKGSPKGIINQALLKITPNKGVSGPFIKHWMQSGLFQSELEKGVGGTALQNVPSVAIMKSIKIHLPQETDQLKILEKLEQFESMMSKVMSIQSQIRRNYLELRQSLLSGAFAQGEEVA